MLSDAELTSMRAVAATALPGTAIIRSSAYSSDGGGGGSYGWTASGTVDCRIAPIRGDEREIAERISADADYIVTLPFNAGVTTDSQLVIGGGTYNVAAIRDRSWNVTTRVEVTKET